jgi:uncharacterized protein (TIGR01777 family)
MQRYSAMKICIDNFFSYIINVYFFAASCAVISEQTMKIIFAGATGFVGNKLVQQFLNDHHTVVVLTRNLDRARKKFGEMAMLAEWDAKSLRGWARLFEGADVVINLAGEPIAEKRWTRAQKESITASRIESTRVLVQAINQMTRKPQTLIQASAVGYYGHVPEGEVYESHDPSADFLGTLCQAWENEAIKAEALGVRVVRLRTGIVLGRNGGALKKMMRAFKLFAGGPLGSGQQWFPWVHEADVLNIIQFAIQNPALSGAVNVTAPNPCTMNDFCTTLGQVLHRPSWLAVPDSLLKLALGELADTLLGGQKAMPKKLLESGYVFIFPDWKAALTDLCR